MTEHERYVVAHLRTRGYELPTDPLAFEIISTAIKCWGVPMVLRGLDQHLEGDEPTYVLEAIGAKLGIKFECPRQLLEPPGA